MIDLYLYSSCSSCRNAESFLQERGVEYRRRDFFRERFTREELMDVLNRAGLTPGEVLSTRAKVYRERGLAARSLGDDELLELMVQEPTLLRRPIAIGSNDSVVGFDRAGLERLTGMDARTAG